jgi:thiamine biosynthesis lipoprotein
VAVFLICLVVLSVHRLACTPSPSPYEEFTGETMGTTYSVKVATERLSEAERGRVQEAITSRLSRVVALMSTWETDSELSRFNRHRAGVPYPVSRETLAVFQLARAVSELSGGAFDVTVGPLVDAWGFGAADRLPTPPSDEELAGLRERVGYERVAINAAAGTLTKEHPNTECDLSAVAKGYAVDLVAEALLELGYRAFLVEIGGEVRTAGRRGDGSRWRVAIERPDPEERSVHRVLGLEDLALATSGDYRNFYESEGIWISHLIDPRTARPIDHSLASVSVLHREAAWADALATALIVLGPAEGYALADRERFAAYFIVRESNGRLRERATPAFESLAGTPDQVGR